MEVLIKRYRVFTLKEWLRSVVMTASNRQIEEILIMDTDSMSYKALLTDVYVCEDKIKNQNFQLQQTQGSSQRELVIKTIETILKKHGFGKNILTDGFCLLSQDKFAQQCGGNVESRYPNTCVNRLFYSVWDTLLSRIGDTVMMYMLENTSLFYKITDTCFVQLTGLSVNNVTENNNIADAIKETVDIKDKDKCDPAVDHSNSHNSDKSNVDDVDGKNVDDSKTSDVNDFADTSLFRSSGESVREKHDEDNNLVQVINYTDDNNKVEHEDNLIKTLDDETGNKKIDGCSNSAGKSSQNENKSDCDTVKHYNNAETNSVKPCLKRTIENYTINTNKGSMRKRKYEQINDERFLSMKLESTMYAKMKSSDSEDICNVLTFGQNMASENIGSELTIETRKRKISETFSDVSKSDNDTNLVHAKRRKLDESLNDKDRHKSDVNEEMIEQNNYSTAEKKELQERIDVVQTTDNNSDNITTGPGSVYVNSLCSNSNGFEKLNDLKILSKSCDFEIAKPHRLNNVKNKTPTKHKKTCKHGKKVGTKVKTSGNKEHNDKSCMFSYHLVLPRSSALFTRNPRGTFLRSAALSNMEPSPRGTLSLYKEMFCDSTIATDERGIHVKIPEFKQLEIILHHPNDSGISAPSQNPVSSEKHDAISSNSASGLEVDRLPACFQYAGHPSFCSNDSMFISSGILGINACESHHSCPGVSSQGQKILPTKHSSCNKISCLNQPLNHNGPLAEQVISKNALQSNETIRRSSACMKLMSVENKSSIQRVTHIKHSCLSYTVQGKEEFHKTAEIQKEEVLNQSSFKNDTCLQQSIDHRSMVSKLVDNSLNSSLKKSVSQNSEVMTGSGVVGDSPFQQNHAEMMKSRDSAFTQRDDFGYVLVSSNMSKADGLNCKLQYIKSTSRSTLSKKEKLLAKRHDKLIAAQGHIDSNHDPNVTGESDITMNLSHNSGKSSTENCTLENSASTCHSSNKSSNHSDRLTDDSNVGKSLDIDVSVLADVIPLLKEFIERHRSFPYVHYLNHHCPVAKRGFKKTNLSGKIKGRRFASQSVSMLLSSHIHNRQVYLFLRLCVLRVLPDGLLGKQHNLNIVMENISRIVSLGRHEKVTLGQLMNGMKIKEVKWLGQIASNNQRLYLLACVLYWFFSNYVFVILRTFFYITDTSFLRYKLLYYRQTTWNQLHILGMKGLMKRGILKPISEKCCHEMIESRQSLGVSSLRFLPKLKSLRPIMNMGRSVQVSKSQPLSVNKQLSGLHSVFSYLKKNKPSLISHGKLGMDDIYLAWKNYAQQWRSVGSPVLYFVKTDISNCYDSIDQKKLCSLIETLLQNEIQDEEYVVRKYFSVRMKSGCIKKQFHRVVSPLSEFSTDFVSYCKTLVKKRNLHNVIFVDAVVYQHETSSSLITLLKFLLLNTIVKVGSHYYVQSAGISQGSVLSTMLCNIYYANMEQHYLHVEDDELLMRIVDDYLFVTPHRDHAVTFVNRMLAGIPEYNCVTNKEKVLLNFEHEVHGTSLPVITEEWFPWCGLQLNITTLEVALDCSRYSGFNIRDTLTIELSKNPGKSLKEKMIMSVSQKFHSLYVDADINSERRMLTNIYQIFLVTSLKLHAGIRQLPYKERANKNAKYFLGIIQEVSGVMVFLVSRLLQENGPKTDLKLSSIRWLCLTASYKTFRRHHSQYSTLLKRLQKNLKKIENRLCTDHKQMLMSLAVEEYPVDLWNSLP